MFLHLITIDLEKLKEHPCGIPDESKTSFSSFSKLPIFHYGVLKGESKIITETDFWMELAIWFPRAFIIGANILNTNKMEDAHLYNGQAMNCNIFYMDKYCFVVQAEWNRAVKYWKVAPCIHEWVKLDSGSQQCSKCALVEAIVDVSHEW
jgi:hypothetical protein